MHPTSGDMSGLHIHAVRAIPLHHHIRSLTATGGVLIFGVDDHSPLNAKSCEQ